MNPHEMTLVDAKGEPEITVLLDNSGLQVWTRLKERIHLDLEQLLALEQFLWIYREQINARIEEERRAKNH